MRINLLTGTWQTSPIIVEGDEYSDLLQLIDDYYMEHGKKLPVAMYDYSELSEDELESYIPINGGEVYIEGISSIDLDDKETEVDYPPDEFEIVDIFGKDDEDEEDFFELRDDQKESFKIVEYDMSKWNVDKPVTSNGQNKIKLSSNINDKIAKKGYRFDADNSTQTKVCIISIDNPEDTKCFDSIGELAAWAYEKNESRKVTETFGLVDIDNNGYIGEYPEDPNMLNLIEYYMDQGMSEEDAGTCACCDLGLPCDTDGSDPVICQNCGGENCNGSCLKDESKIVKEDISDTTIKESDINLVLSILDNILDAQKGESITIKTNSGETIINDFFDSSYSNIYDAYSTLEKMVVGLE